MKNNEITLEMIPEVQASKDGYSEVTTNWFNFAASFTPFVAEFGGHQKCAELANGGDPQTLTDLRGALWFEWRRYCHNEGCLYTDIKFLLDSIKEKVANQELD